MKKISGMLFIILISAQSAYAFDGNRKGFFVGIGGGIHSISADYSSDLLSRSLSKNGFATSFKIGGGLTDNFVLYYVRNASWYNDDYTYTMGLAGVGATYFFSRSAQSLYLHGGAGLGEITAPLDSHIVEPETGTGYLLGAGYQFKNRLTFEGTFMAVDVDVAESSTFQLLVNYLWY